MKTYTIKPGQINFRPLETPWPIWRPRGFEITFRFQVGGWCSLAEWEGDKDWYDWQKLKGITHFFSANTKRSVMIAYRFGQRKETYEICAYTNDEKGKAFWYGNLLIDSEELVAGYVKFDEGKANYSLASEGGSYLKEKHGFEPFKLGRQIGTYAGGANNSPGPFGGRAIKTLKIDIDFKILK